MNTIKIEDVKFFNQRKLAAAQRVAGEDLTKIVEEYAKLGGYYEVATPSKEAAVKVAKKAIVKKVVKSVKKRTKK